jgi:Ca-activated chloride channel family protein
VKIHAFVIASLAATLGGVTAPAQQPQQAASVSVGIVLDTSGSMAFKLAWARQLVSELLKSANSLDEFTFIQTADRPIALSGYTSASDAMQTIAFIQSKGRSAMLDGVYLGAQLSKTARNDRRVLLVISDGVDNASRYAEPEIRTAVIETGVRVYTVVMNDPTSVPELLPRIAERSGGRHFGIADSSRLPETALELSAAMRGQR